MRLDGTEVLLVEDDPELREAIAETLALAGARVRSSPDGREALRVLAGATPDIVVTDVNMPGIDGHELLRRVRELKPQVQVLLVTAFGSVERSVQAMRDGAVDYLVKPFRPVQLLEAIARYAARPGTGEEEPVTASAASQELLALARQVAASDSTVLLCGESGSGKEVFARYIHRHSRRARGPFVAINCAAIPENMLEALLFGHEKGAFTGAYASMPGKFEQADGGTLLLDEISEMDPGLQAKLLRVLQEREVERLGARRPQPVDVRVIATTNRELRREVADGRFREDRYYRLSVFPLRCLPLRERPDDIVPLAERLARAHANRMHHRPVEFDTSALRALLGHPWPGNVRDLDNAVQRALILQPGATISAAHLRLEDAGAPAVRPSGAQPIMLAPVESHARLPLPEVLEMPSDGGLSGDLKLREFRVIVDTLRDVRGSKSGAAERLGISPRTLRYKLARLRESGLDVEGALIGAR
ncbi:MAG: sigma-54-dependent transcriptional regulator [Gammaproteobacteria bacterium]